MYMPPTVLQFVVSRSAMVFKSIFLFPDQGNGSEESTVRRLHLSSSPAEKLQLNTSTQRTHHSTHEFTTVCFPHLILSGKITKVICTCITVRVDIWEHFFFVLLNTLVLQLPSMNRKQNALQHRQKKFTLLTLCWFTHTQASFLKTSPFGPGPCAVVPFSLKADVQKHCMDFWLRVAPILYNHARLCLFPQCLLWTYCT